MKTMTGYKLFKWDDQDNLTYLGSEIGEKIKMPGMKLSFPDVTDVEVEWIISEVHHPNPNILTKANGSQYQPDSICILRPA